MSLFAPVGPLKSLFYQRSLNRRLTRQQQRQHQQQQHQQQYMTTRPLRKHTTKTILITTTASPCVVQKGPLQLSLSSFHEPLLQLSPMVQPLLQQPPLHLYCHGRHHHHPTNIRNRRSLCSSTTRIGEDDGLSIRSDHNIHNNHHSGGELNPPVASDITNTTANTEMMTESSSQQENSTNEPLQPTPIQATIETTATSTTTTTSSSSTSSNSTIAAIVHGTYAIGRKSAIATTTITPGVVDHRPSPSSRYSIYEMDAAAIQNVQDIHDLTDLVHQVEAMTTLDNHDVGPLLLPLTRITSMKRYGQQGAMLTERILLTCLGRLPADSSDRYHTNATICTTDTILASAPDSRHWLSPDISTTTMTTTTTTTGTTMVVRSRLPYPTAAMYNRVMIAWGHLSNGASAERAESMFQLQLEEYVRELEYLNQQKAAMATTAADASSSSSSSSSSLLLLPDEPFAPPPDRKCYKSVIRAWAVSKERHGAARSFELLREMEHVSGIPTLLHQIRDTHNNNNNNNNNTSISSSINSTAPPVKVPPIPPIEMPDLGTYNVVLSAYAKSFVLKHPIALERVQHIVQRLDDLRTMTGHDEFRLDGYSYVSILQAYSRYIAYCPPPLDRRYSQEVLAMLRLIHERIAEQQQEQPQTEMAEPHFNSRSSSEQAKKRMDRNEKIKMDADNSFLFPLSMSWAYGVAVEALVKTEPLHESVVLADEIVIAMTGRRNRINTPPSSSSSLLSTSHSSVDDNNATPLQLPLTIPYEICVKIWPNHETLMRVVQAWDRSGLPVANERIERLLHIVVAEAEYPRIYHMHEAMEQWCVSGWKSAPFLVESILQCALNRSKTNVRNKPTGQSFVIAMKAWMRSKRKEAPFRAEWLLQHLLHLYEVQNDSWYKPREVHLRYVNTCWLQRCPTGERYDGISGQNLYPAEHCELLLRWLCQKDWFADMAMGQYAMAIRVWASQQFPPQQDDESVIDGDDPNPVQRAVRLLDEYAATLPNGELLPAFPSNWVLEGCGRRQNSVERRLEAYNAAIATFNRCKQNARSFVLTVRVLRTQVDVLDEEHLNVIEDLFRKCCVSGMLTQEMIGEVVDVVSPEALQRLFGLSYPMARLIVDARTSAAATAATITSPSATAAATTTTTTTSETSSHFSRTESKTFPSRPPSVLLIRNLPHEWSAKADTQRSPKERDADSADDGGSSTATTAKRN